MTETLRSTRRSMLAGSAALASAAILRPAGQGGDHIPRMFAALLLITVTGLAVFGLMVGLQQMLLGHWNDSTIKTES